MTRFHYWLHASTQYHLHSPFLFQMYREVLFARISPDECRRLSIPRHDRFLQMAYKCCNYYHLQVSHHQSPITNLRSLQLSPVSHCQPQISILLLDRPHATSAAERQWQHLKADATYQVSLDLYHLALLIRNPHLHPQHLLLR